MPFCLFDVDVDAERPSTADTGLLLRTVEVVAVDAVRIGGLTGRRLGEAFRDGSAGDGRAGWPEGRAWGLRREWVRWREDMAVDVGG